MPRATATPPPSDRSLVPPSVPSAPRRAPARPDGDAFVPELRQARAEAPPCKVDACPAFLLRAHPERWTVCAGRVVPEFGRVVLAAGVNGATDLGGKLSVTDAVGQAGDRGWTMIPVSAVPPEHLSPGETPSYLYRPRGRPDVHLLRYVRVFPGSAHTERDDAGYVRFCDYLQETGIIQQPADYALRRLLDKLHRQRDELARLASENPAYGSALAVSREHAAVVEAELARRAEAGDVPEPDAMTGGYVPDGMSA